MSIKEIDISVGSESQVAVTTTLTTTTDEARDRFNPTDRGCYFEGELSLKYLPKKFYRYVLKIFRKLKRSKSVKDEAFFGLLESLSSCQLVFTSLGVSGPLAPVSWRRPFVSWAPFFRYEMSNCLFEAAYEEILHRCNCTPSFHQTGIGEYPRICTGTKLRCMKSILHRIGKYNQVIDPNQVQNTNNPDT